MNSTNAYEQLYVKLQFERAGLFRLIKKTFPINMVFYPCCSFHITPSFFFSKVYYLDKSEAVASFFKDEVQVNKIIQARKEVSQSDWRFFHSDLEASLENIPEVDLVIALFGGDVLRHAFEKTKPRGFILTSSEFSGETILSNDNRYKCLSSIAFQSGEYRILKSPIRRKEKKKSFTKNNTFRDTLVYSIYQR